jgi:hypothetical protein
MVGGRTSRFPVRMIPDYQVEARRFFFTVDPALFTTRYPNIDILNTAQMTELAASLPETQRPIRVSLYLLILGGQPPNPNGPQFSVLEDPETRVGQVYEHLREGVDYYVDPSQLWIALVRPLSLANERLVAAWTLRIAGRDTVIAELGGTPDLEFSTDHAQLAHLLWDPRLTPDDASFRREIRSVYRLGGDDVRRESVNLRIVAGTSADQEAARRPEHVPRDLPARASDEPRAVRRGEPPLAAPAGPEPQPRLADGGGHAADPRRVHRLSVARAVLATRARVLGQPRT